MLFSHVELARFPRIQPKRTVNVFDDWLGQPGWRVSVCAMRSADDDAELDIFTTERALSGRERPQVGQDLEGRPRRQGRLSWTSSSEAGLCQRPVVDLNSAPHSWSGTVLTSCVADSGTSSPRSQPVLRPSGRWARDTASS